MKKTYKLLSLTFVLAGIISFQSCETLDLDITDDPNFLTPDLASVDFFLNSIQEDFVRQLDGDSDNDPNDNWQAGGSVSGDGLSLFGMELTRLQAMSNFAAQDYNGVYQASDSDDEWDNVYRGILADIRAMTPSAVANDLTHHIGIGQFIEAYVITSMVDFYGDIPYSEALLGADNLNPALDSGASIYDAALVLLDQAIGNFISDASVDPINDFFYDNDYELWVKAAKTLKMKLLSQRRLVDPGAAAAIAVILADEDNYISSTAEDFQYSWPATSPTGPDSRHPLYGWDYRDAGANHYMSNWLMHFLDTTNDPRLRYYIYRQFEDVPGSTGVPPNEEELQCSLQAAPQHYLDGGFTFCYLDNGYWGRDHGDNDGIPPDGLKRALPGVYPCGGMFDDDRFVAAEIGFGGGGAGITPILTAGWVELMRAELALAAGNVTDARTYMEAGLRTQIAKVQAFGAVDTTADLSFAPSAGDVNDFIDSVLANFDAADTAGKWDVFGEQYLVSVFGNGIEAYNFYRRTGAPTTLQPNRAPNPGTFIRSMFYPSNAVNTNSNISQKSDQTQPVFWDTNSSAPAAN